MVVNTDPIVVASLEPGKNLTILKLPENLFLELSRGFGHYQLGSVYELGELEGRGGELLRETVQEYLGVPVDGYMKMPNSKQIPNSLLFLLTGRGETNLGRWDLLRAWWEIKKLRSDKMKSIDLQETDILKTLSLPDGSSVLETDFFRLDELVKKYFGDSKIKKEGIKIEVLNATGEQGLAKKMVRLITNMGGEVIAVGNAEKKQENSNMKCRDKSIKNTYTVQKLETILSAKAEVEEMAESRADVLILVGEDYWQKMI